MLELNPCQFGKRVLVQTDGISYIGEITGFDQHSQAYGILLINAVEVLLGTFVTEALATGKVQSVGVIPGSAWINLNTVRLIAEWKHPLPS